MKYTAFKDNLEDAKKIKLVSKMLKLDSGLGIMHYALYTLEEVLKYQGHYLT